ncbi:NmrA family NAD(P)-binding protein [Lichenihabitans sp. Uapishka_5]|uniref:NmrA family NAD(P)-binding protein n=1 Tax=Lichenihabitans sp. Uapishka_5 TaxID=3037302 RepID=UPI0029E7FB64|nr:NmrA family NAD(P)-binding protein [Lichenihabitans sp. Uapishka_5]MDX7949730.1 NmrA family NAD(P)-binding protein [Lichenihabitans sp. Uapishka_5]
MTGSTPMVVLAGGTGDLGARVAKALVRRKVEVRALLRPGRDPGPLKALGVTPIVAALEARSALIEACRGAVCVASTLNGLGDVIVDAQGRLLEAAVAAGVPRFIPSDFSLDYTRVPVGSNRNFDLRRAFRSKLDAAPIRATSVFNGAFADMLAGEMPLIVRPIRRVLYWEDADHGFPLTTKDDTAAVTAAAALDSEAPRDLHVAGSVASARILAETLSRISGQPYRPLRFGSLQSLRRWIGITRRIAPQANSVFPAWQAMQYLDTMFSGQTPAAGGDNNRYPDVALTPIDTVLRAWLS